MVVIKPGEKVSEEQQSSSSSSNIQPDVDEVGALGGGSTMRGGNTSQSTQMGQSNQNQPSSRSSVGEATESRSYADVAASTTPPPSSQMGHAEPPPPTSSESSFSTGGSGGMQQQQQRPSRFQGRPVLGSLVAGGILGFLLGNLIGLSTLGAISMATFAGYVAANRNDDFGDKVRLVGRRTSDLAARAATFAKEHRIPETLNNTVHTAVDKVKELDQKAHLSEKTVAVANAAIHKAEELNQKYHVTEKVANVGVHAVESAKAVDQKLHLQQGAAKVVGLGKSIFSKSASPSGGPGMNQSEVNPAASTNDENVHRQPQMVSSAM